MAADGEEGGQNAVRDIATLGEIRPEVVRAAFPAWRIFSTGGTWWATRGGPQAWTGPESLLMRVLGAADLTGLAERLCLQDWLDRLDPVALEAVYRGTMPENTP